MAVADVSGQRRVLAAVDAPARRLGLRPGMPVAQAQTISLELAVVEGAPEADRAGLERLALWCLRYAPLVALDPPDGLWIEVAGAAHLLGGEEALIADLVGRIEGGGFCARAAVADTPGAAWAMARFRSRTTVIPSGEHPAILVDLPVRALRLSSETAAGLTLLGIDRIGRLDRLPRAALRRRFGEALSRLDQAFGRVVEPLAYLDPPETPLARLVFAEPISALETLLRVVANLTVQLAADLERTGLGARRLDLVALRVDGLSQSVSIGTARASRDARHLARLFGERLGLIDPGYGIETMLLVAAQVEPLGAHQLSDHANERGTPDPAAMAELVDRLSLRLGCSSVYRLAPVESEWPERTVRRVPPLTPATGMTWDASLPRPARLLDPPEPVLVTAMLPDHPPATFTWRRVRRRVALADGPERLFGEWWRGEDEVAAFRDYYRVEDETGARFWLFRDGPAVMGARWFLHGLGAT